MKALDKTWKIVLYGASGLGVNMLNLIIGTYLCSALLVGGFDAHIKEWTYLEKDLVIAGLWSILVLATKIIDGIIDIPLSSFTDNLRTRFGRRRPSIIIGYIPCIVAYLLFLVPINSEATILNTVWFAVILALFYSSYTLTMITYYATFAEIVETDRERVLLSNVKSVCDVVYFIFGYALVPAFVSMDINIRIVALIFLPLALTMLIPLFMIKEPSTVNGVIDSATGKPVEKRVGFITSLKFSLKNKNFIFWLCILAVMNIGLQLFLSGINEFFSTTGLNMTVVMACSFVPVPFTLILYNKIVSMKGFRFAYQYILLMFSIGMSLMFFCQLVGGKYLLFLAIICSIIVSFGIGAFFSVTYIIPSQLASEETKKTGVCASSMYFAVQGLFEGISAGLATGVILVFLKQNGLVRYTTVIVAAFCMLAFVLAYFLPKSIANIGKKGK